MVRSSFPSVAGERGLIVTDGPATDRARCAARLSSTGVMTPKAATPRATRSLSRWKGSQTTGPPLLGREHTVGPVTAQIVKRVSIAMAGAQPLQPSTTHG